MVASRLCASTAKCQKKDDLIAPFFRLLRHSGERTVKAGTGASSAPRDCSEIACGRSRTFHDRKFGSVRV